MKNALQDTIAVLLSLTVARYELKSWFSWKISAVVISWHKVYNNIPKLLYFAILLLLWDFNRLCFHFAKLISTQSRFLTKQADASISLNNLSSDDAMNGCSLGPSHFWFCTCHFIYNSVTQQQLLAYFALLFVSEPHFFHLNSSLTFWSMRRRRTRFTRSGCWGNTFSFSLKTFQ